jgi:hypothetical protein
MDYTYCYKYCEKGKAEANKILANSDSVSDAAIDCNYFVEDCFGTCLYKEAVLAMITQTQE